MSPEDSSDLLLHERLEEALDLHAANTRVPAFGAIAARARKRRRRRTAVTAAVVAAAVGGGVSVAAAGFPDRGDTVVATPADSTLPSPAAADPTWDGWEPQYRPCTAADVTASLTWTGTDTPARGLLRLRLRSTATDACDAARLFVVPLDGDGQELTVQSGPRWLDDTWRAVVLDRTHDLTSDLAWPNPCGAGSQAAVRIALGPDHVDVSAPAGPFGPCPPGSTHRFEFSPPVSVER